MASSYAARLLHAVVYAVQVETHGQYSVDRLRALHDYISSTSNHSLRLVVELLATPLPCLAMILLLDAIPLAPPSSGVRFNRGFMVRATMSGTVCGLCLITLYETMVPTLRLPRYQVSLASIVSSVGTLLAIVGLSVAIGFSVPFAMTLVSPLFLGQLGLFLLVSSASRLRSSPSARASTKDCVKVVVLMGTTMMVYPVCNYAFEQASTEGQMAFSLLMAAIKLAYKLVMGKCVRENGDLRAEIVNCHSEVPHALFVAFSMQTANSMLTVAVFLAVDAIHACAILYDMHHLTRRITRLEEQCRGTSPDGDMLPVSPSRQPGTMIDRALDIASRRGDVVKPQPPPYRLEPMNQANQGTTRPPRLNRLCVWKSKKIAPAPSAIVGRRVLAQAQTGPTARANGLTLQRTDAQTSAVSAVEDEYVDAVLQLLYMTEFVVLAEMIETVVPVVYGVYMAAMVHMPNRLFISSLSTSNPADLQPVLLSMLAYALVEFASLFGLCAVLRRQLGFSPASQLTMVLRTRRRSVHAALVFWLIVSVQARLEHYGVDYSFQFTWLRK